MSSFFFSFLPQTETSRVQQGPNKQMGSQQRLTRNSCDASRLEHVHTSDKQWRLTSLKQLCKIKMWKDVRVSWIIYKSELVRVVDRLPVIRKMSGWSLNFFPFSAVLLMTRFGPSFSCGTDGLEETFWCIMDTNLLFKSDRIVLMLH